MVLDKNALRSSKHNAVVKLIKNLYGLKDTSWTRVDHSLTGLINHGFTRNERATCFFIYLKSTFLSLCGWCCLSHHQQKKGQQFDKDLEKCAYMLMNERPHLGISGHQSLLFQWKLHLFEATSIYLKDNWTLPTQKQMNVQYDSQ